MRSLVELDSHDLRELACPWCGRTPRGASGGFKAVREGRVVGALAFAAGADLGGMYPANSIVVLQLWVRREDLGELIGTQLVQRLAAAAPQRTRCVIAAGTHRAGDCRRLPAAWLEAYDAGRDRSVSGQGNLLMSINAHVNRDFPFLLDSLGLVYPDGSSRKPDHDRALITRKVETVPQLSFNGAPIVDIDATIPYSEELALATAAVDKALAGA